MALKRARAWTLAPRCQTHQWLQGADVFELVPAEVQMRQVHQTFGQNLQTSGYPVVAQLQLRPHAWVSTTEKLAASLRADGPFVTFLSLSSLGISATLHRPTLMRLSSSRLENSPVIPSIFPFSQRQLSRTSSFTCGRRSHTQMTARGALDVQSVTFPQWLIRSLKSRLC